MLGSEISVGRLGQSSGRSGQPFASSGAASPGSEETFRICKFQAGNVDKFSKSTKITIPKIFKKIVGTTPANSNEKFFDTYQFYVKYLQRVCLLLPPVFHL